VQSPFIHHNHSNFKVELQMADAPGSRSWIRQSIVAGIVYFVVGYGSALVDPYISDHFRFTWRLLAWLAAGLVFAAHIVYEYFHQHNSPRTTALHTAVAVGCGGLLLAVAATVRATTAVSHAPYSRYLLALVAWPLITALPAFLVAFTVTTVLARLPMKK
jgi:hypothetical protein